MNSLGFALLIPLVACAQSITGRFVDPAQASIGKVDVELLPAGGDWVTRSTYSEPNGSFQFLLVEPGAYVIVAGAAGFQSRVVTVRVSSGHVADVGTLVLRIGSCDRPGTNCDSFFGGAPPPPPPPVPAVDLCKALKSPNRYGNKPIVMVGMLTTVRGRPALTAACDSTLASGGLTWTNAVLLPEGAVPQTVPDVPQYSRFQKEARGSCRSRQKDQRFANLEGRCSLWIPRHTRRPPGRSLHRRFLRASRYPDAPCELSESRWIRRTQVGRVATNGNPL